MSNKILLAFLLFFVSSYRCHSQYGPIKIFLKGDSVILTKYALLSNARSFKYPQPSVTIHYKEGPRLTIEQIDHVEGRDKNGNFRYFGVATFQSLQIFAERVLDGERIDLYRNNVIQGDWNFSYSNKLLHYAKDGREMKRVKYRNLKADLRDNKESLQKLRGASAIRFTQLGLYALGAFILVKTAKDEAEKPLSPPGSNEGVPTGFFVGAGVLWLPWIINGAKLKQFEKACEIYE